jgi:hypothetical protein
MPDLSELESLVRIWRGYIDANPAGDDFTRASGYLSGLKLCADQLAETLERMRADA